MLTRILSIALLVSEPVGRISYSALSDEACKTGQLDLYKDVPVNSGNIEVGGYKLEYSLPKKGRAYDVIPIEYTLTQPAGTRRAAVEAIAFEDAAKAGDAPLFDLAIPGNMGIELEYLGSICADFMNDEYIPLTADPKTPVSPYPPFKRDELVCSSTIREADAVWFKFRITNTGDTIFDPEGIGATLAGPILIKFADDGSEEWRAQPVNLFERQLEYIYPGESVEEWVNFWCPQISQKNGLSEGNYRVDFRMLYKYYREYDWMVNIWEGAEFARLEVPIKVTADGGNTPVETRFEVTDTDEKMPGYIDYFEEFMTAFRIHQPVEQETVTEGTLYLQVAPWTEKAVVKLILTDPKEIAVAKVPVEISLETLDVKYNPDNVMVLDNGEPAFIAMAMPGMRAGFQLGPFPEQHMRDDIMEMREIGVNVVSNTAGGWWISELTGREGVEMCSAQYKYWYDVLMREAGMQCLGWSVYPPSGIHWYEHAAALLGEPIEYEKAENTYGYHAGVDMADPAVPKMIAAWVKYQYERWGDYWFRAKDGRMPIDMEDSWGWMRDDINIRYMLGPISIRRFREWVQAKYGTIEKANEAWGSDFESFDEIDPQANQGVEGDGMPMTPVYNNPDNPFHDWSPAVEDWDIFRTELRMEVYRKANTLLQEFLPGAEIAVRTEGANVVIKGDGKSDNMHWRHAFYSQRRNAMVFDIVKDADTLHFYSDYTTLPYTESEWRESMREMVDAGVIPMFLPQFDHMRDILLNPYYGREYKMHYNLDKPSKGIMIHCLMAAYPWWRATYEEGGAPGIIYADYLCDGFATETQKRELKLLTEHFRKMRG
ncbi:MAG: beta-galactosidase [Armatimonadota bacterium]